MKMHFEIDEWHPLYILCDGEDFYKRSYEVPEHLVSKWRSVQDSFVGAQAEIRKFIKNNK